MDGRSGRERGEVEEGREGEWNGRREKEEGDCGRRWGHSVLTLVRFSLPVYREPLVNTYSLFILVLY